jgi:hypothetical protein
MQSKDVQEAIVADLGDLPRKLIHNTRQYVQVRKLTEKLAPAKAKLETQIPPAILNERPLDVLGLVRFSFPSRAQSELQRLLRQLGTKETRSDATQTKMTAMLFHALRFERGAPDPTRLAVNAALLWIAELYPELVERLGPHRHRHYSLTAIYGAAAVEAKRLNTASKAADELEEMLRTTKREDVRSAISVGLAYLYYHLALAKGFRECWDESRMNSSLDGVAAQDVVEKAIQHARDAAGNTSLDPSLHVYAVNLAVMYGMALPVSDRNRLRQLTVQLLQYKSHPVWQYRYEDTIARYFFLAAMEARSGEELQRNLRLAEHHSGAASEKAPFDPRISQFEVHIHLMRPMLEARFPPSPGASAPLLRRDEP